MNTITVLSLGAGVQSTCVLLMAEHGEIERPDEAIFADTQREPATVYAHLDWLRTQTSIPIVTVATGDLGADILTSNGGFSPIPLYVRDAAGTLSMLPRQCTYQYKVRPIRRRVRVLMTERGLTSATLLMGISRDEATRMKPADVKYLTHRWPLVERSMSRHDCINWLTRHGYPEPPKSACYFCPFIDNARWATMRRTQPAEFARAVAFDKSIRTLPRIAGEAFIFRRGVPLEDAALTPEDRGQLPLFDMECEGFCGV